jgi:hypothetical protein
MERRASAASSVSRAATAEGPPVMSAPATLVKNGTAWPRNSVHRDCGRERPGENGSERERSVSAWARASGHACMRASERAACAACAAALRACCALRARAASCAARARAGARGSAPRASLAASVVRSARSLATCAARTPPTRLQLARPGVPERLDGNSVVHQRQPVAVHLQRSAAQRSIRTSAAVAQPRACRCVNWQWQRGCCRPGALRARPHHAGVLAARHEGLEGVGGGDAALADGARNLARSGGSVSRQLQRVAILHRARRDGAAARGRGRRGRRRAGRRGARRRRRRWARGAAARCSTRRGRPRARRHAAAGRVTPQGAHVAGCCAHRRSSRRGLDLPSTGLPRHFCLRRHLALVARAAARRRFAR